MTFVFRSNSSLFYAAHPLHCFPVRLDQGSDLRWMGQWRTQGSRYLLQVRAFFYCSKNIHFIEIKAAWPLTSLYLIPLYRITMHRNVVQPTWFNVLPGGYKEMSSILADQRPRKWAQMRSLSQWVELHTGAQINFWRSNSIFNLYACSHWFPKSANERREAVTWPYLQDPASAWQAPAAVRPPPRRRSRPRPDRRVRGASPRGGCGGGNRRPRRCPQRDDPAPPGTKTRLLIWQITQGRRDSWRRRIRNHFGALQMHDVL